MNWPVTLPSGLRMDLAGAVAGPQEKPDGTPSELAGWYRTGGNTFCFREHDWPAFCTHWAEYEAACRERYKAAPPRAWNDADSNEVKP